MHRVYCGTCATLRHGKGKRNTSAHESITGAAQSGLPISTITVCGRQPQSARLCSSRPAKPRSARIRGKPIPRPILFASSRKLYCLVPPLEGASPARDLRWRAGRAGWEGNPHESSARWGCGTPGDRILSAQDTLHVRRAHTS